MEGPIDDYLAEVEAHLEGPPEHKRQILRELRGHLEERMADLTDEDPHSDPAEIARYVVRDFGNARELALAYDAHGRPELHDSAGRTVLTVSEAVGRGARVAAKGAVVVGRGTGKVLKVVAVVLAVLLVLAVGVAVFAWYEVRPIIERNLEYDVYSSSEECSTDSCPRTPVEETFFIHRGAREVRMDLNIHHEETLPSSVRITVIDPDGDARFDRTFSSGDDEHAYRHFSWGPAVGDWTIRYDYSAFRGSLWVDIDTVGAPEGSLTD